MNELYKQWVDEPSITEAQRNELLSIASDEEEISDRFYTGLVFGTAGMRGVLGMGTNRMNEYTVCRATAGLAEYICSLGDEACRRGVVISYDTRHFSAEFASLAASVLAAYGVDVFLFDDARPVPVLSFTIRERKAISGIMITASHNPPQYNGYKVYWSDGAQLSPVNADKVAAYMEQQDYFGVRRADEAQAAKHITLIGKDDDEAFLDRITSLSLRPDILAQYAPKLKMVYTPLHGTGRYPVAAALKRIGITNFTVVREQEEPDGSFPTVKVPNPEFVDTFALAIEYAKKTDADLLIGTDPDADRMGVVVRTGDDVYTALTGNQIGAILLHYILSQKSATGTLGKNAYTVKSIVSGKMNDAIASDFGCKMYSVLTGFKFVGEQMQKCEDEGNFDFTFAYEESFGFLCGPHARDKDGVSATMMIAEAAAFMLSQGKTLYDYLEELYARYGYFAEFTHSKFFEGESGMEHMNALMDSMRKSAPAEIAGRKVLYTDDISSLVRTYADGTTEKLDYSPSNVLRFELEGGDWASMRPSGTEPKLKIYGGAHGADKAAADRAAKDIRSALEQFL